MSKRDYPSGVPAIRPSVSLSLVPEAVGGPFVLQDSLADGIRRAAALGFPAVEILARSVEQVPVRELKAVLTETGMAVSAFATGGGFMLRRLHLSHPDAAVRQQAFRFILDFIALAAEVGSSPVVGLMRGVVERGDSPAEARQRMEDAVAALDEAAGRAGVTLLIEPINRYETGLINRLDEGVALIETRRLAHTRLLADTFHMNIEEGAVEAALAAAAKHIGHVHWADSNRRPPRNGHLDFAAIGAALRGAGYAGYVAFECLPYPDPDRAAVDCLKAFRAVFGPGAGDGVTESTRHEVKRRGRT